MPKSGGGGDGLSLLRSSIRSPRICSRRCPRRSRLNRPRRGCSKLPGGPTQPLTVHLRQEIDRLNIILDLCRSTLKNLRLAIAGTVALSGDLVDALEALFDAKIPPKWLGKSWQSATIGSWFQGLLQRP